MAIDESFLKTYLDALKRALMTSDMHDKYQKVLEDYENAKKKINSKLESMDSVCTDAERLIDKETGGLKKIAELIVGDDTALRRTLNDFRELWLNLQSFAEFGWKDELVSSIDPVLAIADYSSMEDRIMLELGSDKGQRVIYEIKKKAVEFEESIGKDFFRIEVLKLRDLFRIKQLFSNKGEIKIIGKDNLKVQSLVLTNGEGEKLKCNKVAEIIHNGASYLELELLEDLKICTFNYYVTEDKDGSQALRLIEDRALVKLLDEKRDKIVD